MKIAVNSGLLTIDPGLLTALTLTMSAIFIW
jgi:hypothetical protein